MKFEIFLSLVFKRLKRFRTLLLKKLRKSILISNYIKGFAQEPQKREKFLKLIFFLNLILAKAREKKKRGRLGRLERLGRLGLCVCQTKNPMQRWVQQLVL